MEKWAAKEKLKGATKKNQNGRAKTAKRGGQKKLKGAAKKSQKGRPKKSKRGRRGEGQRPRWSRWL